MKYPIYYRGRHVSPACLRSRSGCDMRLPCFFRTIILGPLSFFAYSPFYYGRPVGVFCLSLYRRRARRNSFLLSPPFAFLRLLLPSYAFFCLLLPRCFRWCRSFTLMVLLYRFPFLEEGRQLT